MRVRYGMRIAALIDFDPAHDSEYSISFCHRVAKFLDDEGCTAFGTAVAVGGVIERPTLTCRAQKVCSIEPKIHLR